jgi:hypothetical protein
MMGHTVFGRVRNEISIVALKKTSVQEITPTRAAAMTSGEGGDVDVDAVTEFSPVAARPARAADMAGEGGEASGIEAIPRLVDAVKRKLDQAIIAPVASPEKKPQYITLNMRGRALYDLAFILSKVRSG